MNLKGYAEGCLAKYIGADFSKDHTQIQFCRDFRRCLEYIRFQENTIVVNENLGLPIVGCTFEDTTVEGVPMLIHSPVFQ